MSPSICPNCEASLHAGDRFCAQCGQAILGTESVRSILDQFLGDYFTFDSKIVRSIVPLLIRPGFLTEEFFRGRRARYIPPLRMFIFLSIVFFLLMGSGPSAAPSTETDMEHLRDEVFWDRFFTTVLPRLFFLYLPLFAALVMLFYRTRPVSFVRAFVLSAHYHAFIFLVFALYGLASRAMVAAGWASANTVLVSLVLAYALVYLWVALRRIHPRPLLRHSLNFLGLVASYTLLLAGSAVLTVWALR